MSRKLIILPYNLYKSLLSAPAKPDEDLQGKAPLEEAKVALWRSKKVRRGEDLSTRNVMHQQMLRSYLKARKEFAEKPLKLQMGELRALLKERDDALKAMLQGQEGEVSEPAAVGVPLPETAKLRTNPKKLKRKMRKTLAFKGLIPKKRRIKEEEVPEEETEEEEEE